MQQTEQAINRNILFRCLIVLYVEAVSLRPLKHIKCMIETKAIKYYKS